MKDKYLNLIELSVMEHKKFSLYETIKDEIIDYVSENAELVINNIKDEEVLNSYIKKIVSTAMVVVPKRLNVKVVRKSEPLDLQYLVNSSQEASVTDSIIENSVDKTVEGDFLELETDNEVNAELDYIDQIDENIDESEEEVSTEADFEENSIETLPEESIAEDFDATVEEYIEQDVLAEKIIDENLVSDFTGYSEDVFEVNQTLVDNMINGVSQNVADEFVEAKDVESDNFIENDSTDYDDLENLELVEDVNLDLNSDSSDDNYFEEDLTEEDSSRVYSEEDSLEEDIEKDNENKEINNEDFSVDVETEVFTDDVESTEELYEENNTETFELVEDLIQGNNVVDTDAIDDIEVERSVSQEEIYNVCEDISPNYECFNYEPSNFDFDSQEICEELILLNEKYPEKYILKICEYRYYQKLSIAEISKSLNIQVDDVVDVLNLIVDAIKD